MTLFNLKAQLALWKYVKQKENTFSTNIKCIIWLVYKIKKKILIDKLIKLCNACMNNH